MNFIFGTHLIEFDIKSTFNYNANRKVLTRCVLACVVRCVCSASLSVLPHAWQPDPQHKPAH